jgi:hypothetical protein
MYYKCDLGRIPLDTLVETELLTNSTLAWSTDNGCQGGKMWYKITRLLLPVSVCCGPVRVTRQGARGDPWAKMSPLDDGMVGR